VGETHDEEITEGLGPTLPCTTKVSPPQGADAYPNAIRFLLSRKPL
jgi:hypothetical protein